MSAQGFWRRIIWRRSARQIKADVDAELQYHLEQRIAELERRGLSPADARLEAMRRFGDVDVTRNVCVATDERREGRMRRRDAWLDVLNDARIGVRQLSRRPGFAFAAIGTLAIAIGFATATYSVADHVLFRPLPFPNTPRAVTLWEHDTKAGADREVSPGNFMDWKERVTLFEEFALAEPWGADLTGGDGPPESLSGWGVTRGWFEALGVQPMLGRLPDASEYAPDPDGRRMSTRVVVLTHELWQRRFGGDASLVGRTIQLDGAATTVIGILPAGLTYPADDAQIWFPMITHEDERNDRYSDYMRVIGLLKPNVTVAQAQAQLDDIARWQTATYPRTNSDYAVVVRPLSEQVLGNVRPALLMLLGAVMFVLLIACANVAGLLIARGTERQREISVRAALGGSRARLVRQLLIESFVLALVSGIGGILLAAAILQVIPAIAPAELPRLDAVRIDARIALVTAALTCLVALLFGAAPAVRASRANLIAPLRSTRAHGAGNQLRRLLVIGELALALVLLTGAGLMGRSFMRLLNNELGFDPENRAALQVFLWDRNPTAAQRIAITERLLERMRALPTVIEAGVTSALPVHPHAIVIHTAYRRGDEPAPPAGQEKSVRYTSVSPGYFAAMGMKLRAGRDFNAIDDARGVRVAVVNESFARAAFGDVDPIGRQLRLNTGEREHVREIVAVVNDVRPNGFETPVEPEVYMPHAQSGTGHTTFVVHTRQHPDQVLPALRNVIWEEDGQQAIYHEGTLARMLTGTLAERRFQLALLGTFSVLALVLAGVGIYALISYSTRLRLGEIGVRMALGARSTEIVRMIVGEGVRMAAPGVALGLAGSLLLTRLIAGMLYDVSANDPMTLAQVSIAMVLVAVAAAYVPARRAARLDPARTLRADA